MWWTSPCVCPVVIRIFKCILRPYFTITHDTIKHFLLNAALWSVVRAKISINSFKDEVETVSYVGFVKLVRYRRVSCTRSYCVTIFPLSLWPHHVCHYQLKGQSFTYTIIKLPPVPRALAFIQRVYLGADLGVAQILWAVGEWNPKKELFGSR